MLRMVRNQLRIFPILMPVLTLKQSYFCSTATKGGISCTGIYPDSRPDPTRTGGKQRQLRASNQGALFSSLLPPNSDRLFHSYDGPTQRLNGHTELTEHILCSRRFHEQKLLLISCVYGIMGLPGQVIYLTVVADKWPRTRTPWMALFSSVL